MGGSYKSTGFTRSTAEPVRTCHELGGKAALVLSQLSIPHFATVPHTTILSEKFLPQKGLHTKRGRHPFREGTVGFLGRSVAKRREASRSVAKRSGRKNHLFMYLRNTVCNSTEIPLKFHCNFYQTPDAADATTRRIFAKSGRVEALFARIRRIPMKTIVSSLRMPISFLFGYSWHSDTCFMPSFGDLLDSPSCVAANPNATSLKFHCTYPLLRLSGDCKVKLQSIVVKLPKVLKNFVQLKGPSTSEASLRFFRNNPFSRSEAKRSKAKQSEAG